MRGTLSHTRISISQAHVAISRWGRSRTPPMTATLVTMQPAVCPRAAALVCYPVLCGTCAMLCGTVTPQRTARALQAPLPATLLVSPAHRAPHARRRTCRGAALCRVHTQQQRLQPVLLVAAADLLFVAVEASLRVVTRAVSLSFSALCGAIRPVRTQRCSAALLRVSLRSSVLVLVKVYRLRADYERIITCLPGFDSLVQLNPSQLCISKSLTSVTLIREQSETNMGQTGAMRLFQPHLHVGMRVHDMVP